MKKIYLAGPDVFYKDVDKIALFKKNTCLKYGFEPIFPLDLLPKNLFTDKYCLDDRARIIKKACVSGIKQSDFIVSNMTPFRGISMDVGTAFEMGYADALDKLIFAYSTDESSYLEKVIEASLYKKTKDTIEYDINDSVIENFQKIDNCMTTEACKLILFKQHNETENELFERLIYEIQKNYI